MTLFDIALTLIPSLGDKGVVHLLDVFGSAEKIFSATRDELIHFARLRADVADAIVGRSTLKAAEREAEHCRRSGITPIASTDEDYPPLLLDTPDYPHVIYVVGDPHVLRHRSVSLVGTRRITSYGDRMAHDIVHELGSLVSPLSIVSGLAFGVDSAAHRAALNYNIPTVAVIANALPGVTPTQHTALAADILEQGGVILSECNTQTKYRNSLYIARNRIVAALSSATIVVESPLSGGSMKTAQIASGYNRLVMAVPARLTDPSSAGCNMLIRNNVAQMYLGASQLVRELMWDCATPSDRVVVEPLVSNFTPEQQALLSHFSSSEPIALEQLAAHSGLDAATLSAMLMELELEGAVRMLPGSRYERLHVIVSC